MAADAVAVAADSAVVDAADGGAADDEAEAALARFCWVVHLSTEN